MSPDQRDPWWWRWLLSAPRPASVWRDAALLGARLYAGISIAMAGLEKLPTPDWMVDQVIQLQWFPSPQLFAFLACFVEFVGGVLLALGLFTPLSSLVLAFTLGVAAFGFQRVLPFTGMPIPVAWGRRAYE